LTGGGAGGQLLGGQKKGRPVICPELSAAKVKRVTLSRKERLAKGASMARRTMKLMALCMVSISFSLSGVSLWAQQKERPPINPVVLKTSLYRDGLVLLEITIDEEATHSRVVFNQSGTLNSRVATLAVGDCVKVAE